MIGLIVVLCALIALVGTVVIGNRKKLEYLKNQLSENAQILDILILRYGKKREAEKDQKEGTDGRDNPE